MVGAAAQAVSATRIAIRILRENILSCWAFEKSILEKRTERHHLARTVPDSARALLRERAVRLEYTLRLRIFSERQLHPIAAEDTDG